MGNAYTKDGSPSLISTDAPSVFDLIDHRPFVVAHRYGNTISSLKMSEQAGADIVEVDLWTYRGRLEVRHTKTLGPVPLLWDRWSIARGWTPRLQLSDLLAALAPDTLLMIDVKGREPATEQIIETLQRCLPDRPVLICSQNWEQVDRFRSYPHATLVYSIGNSRQLRRAWDQLEDNQWEAISIQSRLLDERVVRALNTHTPIVMTWAINSRERLAEVLRWGVSGITSDNLELIANLIEDRRSRPTVTHRHDGCSHIASTG